MTPDAREDGFTADAASDAARPERVGVTRSAAYSRVQVALHWLVAALVVEQYGTSGAIVRTHTMHMIGQRQNPADLVLHTMHNRLGLLLTAAMVVRLAYRLWAGAPVPATDSAAGAWAPRVASLVHVAFYAVLICEGVAGAVASYLWWPMSVVHVTLFKGLLALVAVHVAAVLWHHLCGEAVLRRMGIGWIPAYRRVGGTRALAPRAETRR